MAVVTDPRSRRPSRRVALAIATTAVTVAACGGPVRDARPPEPELIPGAPATTTPPDDTATTADDRAAGVAGGDDPSGSGDAGGSAGGGATLSSGGVELDDPSLGGWAVFDAELRDRLLRNGNQAVAVAVAVDGDVVHEAAFGQRLTGGLDPVEPHDRFRIASISKVVTATVVLTLVDDGSLDLDEPVGARLAAHVGVEPGPGIVAITPERLLSHTSGFGRMYGTFFGGGAESCEDAAAQRLARPASGGGGFAYSNMNYCALGLLIEAVTGTDYELAVYERLLTPLGITGMRLAGTDDVGPDEVEHVTGAGRNYMETLGGAGSWIASASDVALILDSLNPVTTGWSPLSEEMLAEMRRPVGSPEPAPGAVDEAVGRRGYSLGLINEADGSFGHTGTIENTHAMATTRPDDVTWAVLVSGPYPSETDDLGPIVTAALDAAFPPAS